MAELRYLAVYGHDDIRERFRRAIENGRLPQSLLLHGRRGIGKQRLALWIAAALNCRGDSPKPCAACRACRLAARLEHPDIHWFFPLPRPKAASSPDKLERKLENLRCAALEDRRANLYHMDEQEGATGIYVAAVHTMRRLVQKTPAMGPAKVLVIGRAEALVPQAASPEAANALLKLLEEPPSDTTLILTSDAPGALLPTIRSRVQAVRVPALSDDDIRRFLLSELGMTQDEARALAARCGGSIGRALELATDERDRVHAEALDLAKAALQGRQTAFLAAAHRYTSFGARGAFARVLSHTRSVLRDLLAESLGAVPDSQRLAPMPQAGAADPGRLLKLLEALDEAQALAERNVNPQLIVVNLLRKAGASTGESTGRHGGPRNGR